jgi:hypothetical protein
MNDDGEVNDAVAVPKHRGVERLLGVNYVGGRFASINCYQF